MESGTPVFTGYDAPIRQSLIGRRLLLGVPYFLGLAGSAITIVLILQLSWPASWLWRIVFYGCAWGLLAGGLAWLTRYEPYWMELFIHRLLERDLLE